MTEPSRRRVLAQVLGAAAPGLVLPAHAGAGAATAAAPRLLASWQQADTHELGVLALAGRRLLPLHRLALPTRAHGLLAAPGGALLAVARRPGDWLLLWQPGQAPPRWCWVDDDRRLNGHALFDPDGARLWTTETDQQTGAGLLGLRHAAGLHKTGEWPTQGVDPHQLLRLPQPLGGFPAGTLLVANGGIATRAETGRLKRDLQHMDPSLAALDPHDGRPIGQWRLRDPRLGIRHLAWNPRSQRLGLALQAEHDDAAARAAAPVLALWDGHRIEPAPGQVELQGYGGDICADAGGGFVVGCPRAHCVVRFDSQGRLLQRLPLPHACALAASGDGRWWCAAGAGQAAAQDARRDHVQGLGLPAAWQLDNHWSLLPA